MEDKQLRVWHIPQIPGPAFRVSVPSVDEAVLILGTLALYDLFQYDTKIKPDYSSAQGLEVLEDGEWVEWNSDEGDDINEVLKKGR